MISISWPQSAGAVGAGAGPGGRARRRLNGVELPGEWPDLEDPDTRRPDLSGLQERLDVIALAGMRSCVSISTINTNQLVLPDDLAHATDPTRFAEGVQGNL